MTELQTRIARVLKDFAPTMHKHEAVWCADAIIAELQLEEQTRHPVTAYTRGEFHHDATLRRWVTRWRADVHP
jgi:hypothetical protein